MRESGEIEACGERVERERGAREFGVRVGGVREGA